MEERTKVAVITGTGSGLGMAIETALLAMGWKVYAWDVDDYSAGDTVQSVTLPVDLRWRDEINGAAGQVNEPQIDVLINCAGINHLTPFAQLQGDDWERLMDVNAKALWLTGQALLPKLANVRDRRSGGTILNIISNAAGMPMTHSLAYNASKAAALLVTQQMARELYKSHGVTVFGISPNKLAGTQMSRQIEAAVPALRGWSPEEAEAYQRAGLAIGEETEPAVLAEFIGFLLSTKDRHRYLHGCNIPYGL